MKERHYEVSVRWTGNSGEGTSAYNAYSRNHEVTGAGKLVPIPASSDPRFRGDGTRYNPEEMLVAALSGCHMLWYLHLCSVNGVNVTAYEDEPGGIVTEEEGGGRFTGVILRPAVTVTAESDRAKALHLHEDAARLCDLARSVRFPVTHVPRIK